MISKDCVCSESWHVSPAVTVDSEQVDNGPYIGNPPAWFTRMKRDVIDDLRATRWSRFTQGYLLAIWLLGLVILTTTLPAFLYWLGKNGSDRRLGCLPNDVFNARSTEFNIFDFSGFFQITHGLGDLTFTQAKVVDVVWDVVVGRLGQGVLAFFSWKAFSAHFKKSMNTTPVPYKMFWTVFIDGQPTPLAAWHMIRSFRHQSTRRSKFTMVFIILNIIFVVSFPTFISAMTGYRPNTAAFVSDIGNTLIPYENFGLVAYVIHDGDRVGLGLDHPVPFISPSTMLKLSAGGQYPIPDGVKTDPELIVDYCFAIPVVDDHGCDLSSQVARYVHRYGFFGLVDTETAWINNTTIPKPALNISAFYLPSWIWSDHDQYPSGRDWVDPKTNSTPFSNPSNTRLYAMGTNTTYSLEYIQQNGSCQQRGTYQWGFSFLQAFTISILLLIWSCGTSIMWLRAHKTLADHIDKDVPAKYKAALNLISALSLDLARIEIQPTSLTSKQLMSTIHTDLARGGITTENQTMSVPDYSIRRGAWRWIKEHPFWFGFFFLSAPYFVAWFAFPGSIWYGQPLFVPFHTGMVFALVIGRTPNSRFFFVMVGILGTGTFTAVWATMTWWGLKS